MKILLVAVNAKYIHSNPAVYSLRAYAKEYRELIGIAEYTGNQQTDEILADIYQRRPDVAAFSCYIWNVEYIKEIIRNLRLVMPEIKIWVGGPEVSYNASEFLEEMSEADGVMAGEGEHTFLSLVRYYAEAAGSLEQIPGIVRQKESGGWGVNPAAKIPDMDDIPFIYEDLSEFTNRIIYYESSRGCPYSCSYCLSSIEKKVRFRSLSLVERELQYLLDRQVVQVKFVDRTFNCNHAHALGIWRYIQEHDNGVTNFHFEIAGDLLNEEELSILKKMRPGLVQLEIGVQSVNPKTILEIDRVMDLGVLSEITGRILEGKNIHLHLDLIAGLPFEDYESFVNSFNEVYYMRPHQLQLGFLKLLKGSKMHRKAGDYGIAGRQNPPYEVLYTSWISFEEILKLKGVEEMVEIYFNSHQFTYTMKKLLQAFKTPFAMFQAMSEYYENQKLTGQNHSRLKRIQILRSFALEYDFVQAALYEELLLLDLYLRENSKSRPHWAADLSVWKKEIADFYRKETDEPQFLLDYDGYNYRQRMHMTHLEVFQEDVLEIGRKDGYGVLFDYRKRNPLTGNAAYFIIDKDECN